MTITLEVAGQEFAIQPGMQFGDLPETLVSNGARFATKQQPIELRYYNSTIFLRFDGTHTLENICIHTTSPYVKIDGRTLDEVFPDHPLTKDSIDAWFDGYDLEYSSSLLISCYSTSTPDLAVAIDVEEDEEGLSAFHFSLPQDRTKRSI